MSFSFKVERSLNSVRNVHRPGKSTPIEHDRSGTTGSMHKELADTLPMARWRGSRRAIWVQDQARGEVIVYSKTVAWKEFVDALWRACGSVALNLGKTMSILDKSLHMRT